MFRYITKVQVAVLSFAIVLGCSRSPGRISAPAISASSAGTEAIAAYDSNQDGKISGDELDKCPAYKAAMAQIDKDGDKAITADEITERIEAWQTSKIGRLPVSCTVLRNGRPLPDVVVRFVPEKSLGENMKVAQGTTDPYGVAMISVETTDRTDPPGVAPGVYRVEITKAGEDIPAKYNTDTIFGQEIALDAAGIREGLKFNLTY